jgi:hypothetical protein
MSEQQFFKQPLFSLGDALMDAEKIKAAKAERQGKDVATKKAKNLLALVPQVAAGDEAATRQFITIDPEEGKRIVDAFGAMDENQRKRAAAQVEKVGQIAHFILSGTDEADRQKRYAYAKQNSEPEIADQMPEQYERNFVDLHLGRATEIKRLTENPQVLTMGGYDVAYQQGRPISKPTPNMNLLKMGNDNTQAGLERSNKITLKGMEEGGNGVPKSADESLMYRQVSALFGGVFNPISGEVSFSDKNAPAKVQTITTEAAKLFTTGKYSRSEAVSMAARKYGVNIDDGTQKPGAPAAGKPIKPFM